MEIDLGTEVSIKVKVNGDEYMLREPNFDDLDKMNKTMEGLDDNHKHRGFEELVIDLGMPKDVVKTLGVIRIKKLSEGLLGALSEKK